jgi:GNAT superfamily N-acetyltransferase
VTSQLYRYTPESGADLLLAQWWARLNADGEMDRVFVEGHPLSAMFATLGPPRETFYAFDSQGVWLLAWFEPMLRGALFAGYVRPDRRRTELAKALAREALLYGTATFGVVMGLTAHANVIRFCRAVGFVESGRVPGLFGPADATLIYCTTDTVHASKLADEPPLQVHARA